MRLVDNAFSPFAFKVRAVLYEKALPFVQVSLRTAAEREELRRLNPREQTTLKKGELPSIILTSPRLCPVKPLKLTAAGLSRASSRSLARLESW